MENIFNRISKVEETDLFIAWIVIAVAFVLAGSNRMGFLSNPMGFVVAFLISLLTVGIGFIVHEMSHKFTAIRYGCWSEFRKDTTMLVVSLILAAVTGILFAAPGAAYIRGNLTADQHGWVASAGAISNIILCIPFGAMVFFGMSNHAGMIFQIGIAGMLVNAFLALFNMIPFGNFDGAKIRPWNLKVYVAIIGVSLGLLFISYSVR
jgi:Zn-dependent protease